MHALISQEARAYLEAALDTLQRVTLRSDTVPWVLKHKSFAQSVSPLGLTATHTYNFGSVDSIGLVIFCAGGEGGLHWRQVLASPLVAKSRESSADHRTDTARARPVVLL